MKKTESGSRDSPAPSAASTGRATNKRHNTSHTGELSEAAFLHKATRLDFGVAKPWGNSERYDFILDNGERLWRVQLKCTEVLRARGYGIQPIYSIYGKGKMLYTANDVDVIVAHITPLDVWYVLPIEDVAPNRSLRFYPTGGCQHPRFERYREAWHLLRSRDQPTIDLQACAEA